MRERPWIRDGSHGSSPRGYIRGGPHTPGFGAPLAVTRDVSGGSWDLEHMHTRMPCRALAPINYLMLALGQWTTPVIACDLMSGPLLHHVTMELDAIVQAPYAVRSPRGYVNSGPHTPCLEAHVESTRDVVGGSWDRSEGIFAMHSLQAAEAPWSCNCGNGKRHAPLMETTVSCSDVSDGSTYQRVVEQGLTHMLFPIIRHFKPVWLNVRPPFWYRRWRIVYRIWTCLGNLTTYMLLQWTYIFIISMLLRVTKLHKQLRGTMGNIFLYSRPATSKATETDATPFRCRPSPKSGGSGNTRWFRCPLVWRILIMFQFMFPAAGVRVATESTAVAGARPLPDGNRHIQGWAKPSGVETTFRPHFSFSRKRAYKRAVRRAMVQGHTMYKGKLHTLKQLMNMDCSHVVQRAASLTRTRRIHHVQQDGCCFKILSWNVGGLTNSILDELQVWLDRAENQDIQVVMLQETRWTFTSEWSNAQWAFQHAGHKSHKGSGVLTMVSTKLCAHRQLRSQTIQQGRILHTRFPRQDGTSVDVVNVYQFSWDFQASNVDLLNKRYNLIQNVEKTIKSIPLRNLCICGGDMNVQLSHTPGLVGTATSLGSNGKQIATDARRR